MLPWETFLPSTVFEKVAERKLRLFKKAQRETMFYCYLTLICLIVAAGSQLSSKARNSFD